MQWLQSWIYGVLEDAVWTENIDMLLIRPVVSQVATNFVILNQILCVLLFEFLRRRCRTCMIPKTSSFGVIQLFMKNLSLEEVCMTHVLN